MSHIETRGCGKHLRQSLACGVRCVACHVQVVLLLSFLALRSVSGVPIGGFLAVPEQWLLVASVRRTFLVGGRRLKWSLQFHPQCLAFRRVGGYKTFVARWNVGAQAGCFIAAFGHKRPPRHARTSRVQGSGASGMGARMQLTENRHYLVSSKLARAPFPHENRVLTLKLALVGAIQNCVNHGQATLRARTTPHTDSPSHNGSLVQLDPALHLPDLTGFWPRSQSSSQDSRRRPKYCGLLRRRQTRTGAPHGARTLYPLMQRQSEVRLGDKAARH